MHPDLIESAKRRGFTCLVKSWDPVLEPDMTPAQRDRAKADHAQLLQSCVEGGRAPNQTEAQHRASVAELEAGAPAAAPKKR